MSAEALLRMQLADRMKQIGALESELGLLRERVPKAAVSARPRHRADAESDCTRLEALSTWLRQDVGDNGLILYYSQDDDRFTLYDELHDYEIREKHLRSVLTILARRLRHPPETP